MKQLPSLPAELKFAYLGGSRVENITRDILEELRDVTELSLANGEIALIEDYSFRNLTKMKILDLSNNKIGSLTKETLFINDLNNNPCSLVILDLSSNNIATIEEDAFSSLTNLEVLDLQANSLIVIEQRTFYGLQRVVTLNLNSNSLSVITPNALDHLESIEVTF